MKRSVFILCFFAVFEISYGAKILGIFPCPSYSHQIVVHPLYRELSRRGHKVIAVTPNPLNDPTLTNLTEIDASNLYPLMKQTLLSGFMDSKTYTERMHHAMTITNKFTEIIFENEEFRKLYENAENEKFDLVITEAITPLSVAYGHKFKAPSVGIYTMEAALDQYDVLGGITHPVVYGGMFIDFDYPISMWQKIQNIYYFLWHKYYMKYVNMPSLDQQTRKFFGSDFPSLAELQKNLSLLFVTKNMFMNSVRPTPPNIIQLDFMHIQEPKPLPKDLEQILNNSTQGVVFFSLGSNVKSSTLPVPVINAIIESLNKLPYTVLWKWESDNLPAVKEHVITRKWLPQQDILAHPNVKVFVSQGGLQSCEEAIARGIPVVGLPAMADQEDNIKKLVKLGVAVELSLMDLTSEPLTKAIMEIAENKKYSRKMKEIRKVSFDQPMTSLEQAIWWTEYVIRNKGAPALRSALADVPLYEYLMLDVIAVIFIAIILSVWILKQIIRSVLKLVKRDPKKKKQQ